MQTKHPQWMILTAVFLGTFMALLDLSIVNVALPTMQTELQTQLTGLQWVVDGYTLALSTLILTGGALGDMLGRKRVFLAGIGVFALASAVCAGAPNVTILVIGRFLQGAGASVMVPGALSLLVHAYPDPVPRARMIGAWATFGGLAVVVGPLLGGFLTARFGWPAIFLVNVPLAVVAVAIGLPGIVESRDPEHASADPLGQILAIVWLASLTYAMVEGHQAGWRSPLIVSLLCVAVVVLVLFVVVELRSSKPMLPIRMFANPTFAAANIASFILGFGAYGTYFLISLYIQDVRGADPVQAGLEFLPYSVAIAAASNAAGRLTGRFGPRLPLVAGYALIGVGLLAMLTLDRRTGYPLILVLFLVVGAGMGMAIAPTNAAVMAVVPRQRSGIASATVNACRQTGTALGVAVLGLILTARATDTMTGTLTARGVPADEAPQTAAAAVSTNGVLHPTPAGLSADSLHDLFGDAFSAGFHLSLLVAGVITLAAAVLLLRFIRPAGPPEDDQAVSVGTPEPTSSQPRPRRG